MARSRSNWVVRVGMEYDETHYGPYTQARAEQVAAAINRREAKRTEDERLGDWVHATAYPLRKLGPLEATKEIFQ